jgi:hypothetical protein
MTFLSHASKSTRRNFHKPKSDAENLQHEFYGWLATKGYDRFAQIDLDARDENLVHIELISVNWSKRRSGYGAEILTALCAYADKHEIDLSLQPEALDQNTPDLPSWYARFDFDWRGDEMIRVSNSL